MQALYAFEQGSGSGEHVLNTVLKPDDDEDPAVHKFSTSLFLRTVDRTEEVDAIIANRTKNWELSRIALVDRLLLRMAIVELMTFEDIPPKVTINEAIEVAKRYSTPKSGQFVNGILDAVLLDLQQAGKLKKTGRGLIGMDSLRHRNPS